MASKECETTGMSWHTIAQVEENVYRISEPLGTIEPRFGVTTINMYLVVGQDRAVLIDSGMGIGEVSAEIGTLTSQPCSVLNTHYHWDHIGANSLFSECAIHEAEVELVAQEPDVRSVREVLQSSAARAVLPAHFDPTTYRVIPKPATRVLHDHDKIDLGGRVLRVLHTPGHSPGHVVYLDEASGLLFTGDTAYRGPLFACFEGSNPADFAQSVKRLSRLPGVRLICPGHNDLITIPGWLNELADCVEAAVSGQAVGQLRDGFIVGREYRFGALSVWLPQ
jgi:glyoxylase-like metal-dependent hydrolase (beta-lactamase superfamily II)